MSERLGMFHAVHSLAVNLSCAKNIKQVCVDCK